MTNQELTTPRIWRDQLARIHTVRQTTEDDHEFENASHEFWGAIKGITVRRCTTPEALVLRPGRAPGLDVRTCPRRIRYGSAPVSSRRR
jgi:hypothetical protein